MEKLFKNTTAYKLQELYASRGELRHAYLILYPDVFLIREALRVFAPLFFKRDVNSEQFERIDSLIRKDAYADCLIYPKAGCRFTVENAEKVEEECYLRPVEGKRKLILIGDFSEATQEAQNKLLKLLEEPPESVSFLLGATSSFTVLSTVMSRVEKIALPPFSESEVTAYLLRNVPELTEPEAELCAKASGGIAGYAYTLSSQGFFTLLAQEAWALCFTTHASLPLLVHDYGSTRYPKEFLSIYKNYFYEALKVKIAEERKVAQKHRSIDDENVKKLASMYDKGAILRCLQYIGEGERQVYFNGSFPQVLEITVKKILDERKQV